MNEKITIANYAAEPQPNWCGGCGDYGIWAALKLALVELQIAPKDVLLCFDIGCNGNMSDKIKGYRVHSLHGRVLPLAMGAKIANPNLTVIATAGDGGTYSEGIHHFIHALRAEVPITFLCHDNGNYGLTKGQASSTTPQDVPMSCNPFGNPGKTLNPLELALSLRPSFMAQGFSGNIQPLKDLIVQAIQHQHENRGMSYVNILQSCPTYNKATTHQWYMENTKSIEKAHNPGDILAAEKIVRHSPDYAPTGVIYKNPEALSYFERLPHRNGTTTTLVEEVHKHSISSIMTSLK